jgi:hypothetical protein
MPMRDAAPERVTNAGVNEYQCEAQLPTVFPTSGEGMPIRGAAPECVANVG